MGLLDGRIALVTGAGKGIGKATAELLGREGATVVLTARTAADIEAVADGIRAKGGQALPIAGDVTRDAFVEELFGTIRREYGRLDILVNNAGMAPFGPVETSDVARLRACLELNIVAVFMCIQQAVRIMQENGGTGKIVTIGSVRSRWSEGGGNGFYNASKYGVYGLVETIARQLQGSGQNIACSIVNPGVVDTPLTNPNGEPRPTWLRPEDIARAVLHSVSAPAGVNCYETVVFSTEQKPW